MTHVKISNAAPRVQYVADGTVTEFSYAFELFKEEELVVYIGEERQQDFTLQMNEDMVGGKVIFEEPPLKDSLVTLVRELTIERITDFATGGILRASELNLEFNYLTACLQEIADGLNRSIILPAYAIEADYDSTLPVPEANKILMWNEEGTGLVNSTVAVGELEDSLAQVTQGVQTSLTLVQEKAAFVTQKAQQVQQLASDVAECEENMEQALASKANANLSNIPSAYDYVIESWVAEDGLSWYRRYKSGWIEQGGKVQTKKVADGNFNIYFPVPLVNTPVSFFVSLENIIGEFGEVLPILNYIATNAVLVGIVRLSGSGTDGGTFIWEAKGI